MANGLSQVQKQKTWAGYDPSKVREAISQLAGSWTDVNPDAFLAALYRARTEGSRQAARS